MAKFNDFQWEDDDEGFGDQAEVADSRDSFAQMLAEGGGGATGGAVDIVQGDSVEGSILSINRSTKTVLIEISPSQTGVMDYQDLLEEDGSLTKSEGDRIEAYVVSTKDDAIQLSSRMAGMGSGVEALQMAQDSGLPVKARVLKEQKGGYTLMVQQREAFCPYSGFDIRFVQDKAAAIGQEFDFLVEKCDPRGRNIVLNRRRLLEREAGKRVEELDAIAGSDKVISGVVMELRDYGAFVDVGGVDGFLHISEMSYGRIAKAADIVARGDKIKLAVLSVDQSGDKPRISLSMKAVEQDPWTSISEDFREGGTYTATITKIIKAGAFAQLKLGIEGLIPLSEMSWEKRIYDATTIVQPGQEVTVRILSIDLEQKRLSLSLKDINADPWRDVGERFPEGSVHTGKITSLKGFGALVELATGLVGMLPTAVMKRVHGESYKKKCSPPQEIKVTVTQVDPESKRIGLSLPEAAVDTEDQARAEFREYLAIQEQKTKAAPSKDKMGSFGAVLAAKLEAQQGKKR